MSIFCKHKWVTAETIIAKPLQVTGDVRCSEYLWERTIRGFVTIIRVCEKCGRQERFEVIGEKK